MDQSQRVGAVTALFLVVVATCVVLYYRFSAPGKRQWKALDPMCELLWVVCLLGWVSWVASARVVRPWAAAIGIDGHWILGVAPSLIAGVTVTAFAAFMLAMTGRRGPLPAFLIGSAAMLVIEVVQLWLPGRVFDPFDVLAGVCGVALTMIPHRYALWQYARASGERER